MAATWVRYKIFFLIFYISLKDNLLLKQKLEQCSVGFIVYVKVKCMIAVTQKLGEGK